MPRAHPISNGMRRDHISETIGNAVHPSVLLFYDDLVDILVLDGFPYHGIFSNVVPWYYVSNFMSGHNIN